MASSRRRTVLGYFAVTVAACLGAQSVTAAVTAPANARAKSLVHMRVATYNASAQADHDRAVADVVRLADEADIVTLQEMSSLKRRNAVRRALIDCGMCPFEGYLPSDAVQGGTPILYRWEKFRFERAGTTQVSDATYVGPKGAGPSTLRAKYINWVQLRERATGRDVYVLNNHTVPSVQGRGGASNPDMAKRLELYGKHMAGIRRLTSEFTAQGGAVVVTGDLNVNYRTDRQARDPLFPYVNLGRSGLRASHVHLGEPDAGTHVLRTGDSSRLIDYVMTSNPDILVPVSQRVLTGYSSDHRPLVVTYTVR